MMMIMNRGYEFLILDTDCCVLTGDMCVNVIGAHRHDHRGNDGRTVSLNHRQWELYVVGTFRIIRVQQ